MTSQYLNSDGSGISITVLPTGIVLSLSFIQDWNITTRTTLRLNDSKLIGETQLLTKLEQMLAEYQIKLEDLDKNEHFTFYLTAQEYTIVPCADLLFFVSSSSSDITKFADMPRLVQFETSEMLSLIELEEWLHKFDNQFPISNILI